MTINLASSSVTRAQLLREAGFSFNQIAFDYDESAIPNLSDPIERAYAVVAAKQAQFKARHSNLTNLLFADSIVTARGEILGKARDAADARRMLLMQSDTDVSVITAMIFDGVALSISAVSVATYRFAPFDADAIESYITSGDWRGKAGAMSIEGWNKKFILSQIGHTSTTMGLDTEILKAFLW